MRSSISTPRRPTALFAALLATGLLLLADVRADATGPGGAGIAAGGAAFPAGPSPRNPAGPTPRNPAGPTPLNPAGSFGRSRGVVVRQPFVGASDPLVRPQPFVSVVGPSSAAGLGGSFFCGVHNRGFASEGFFFDHLAEFDGMVDPDIAAEMLVDGGGVWVFTGE
jgi:hypothetical protein